MLILSQLQAFGAAEGRVNLNLGIREQLAYHFQIHFIVVNHEQAGFRSLKALMVLFPFMDFGAGSKGESSQFMIIYNVLFQHDKEG